MKILAFDTSTKFLTIACMEDEAVMASFHEDAGVKHSEILIPTIKGMLEGLGWELKDLGLVCVGLGPGSFTGLRIAVATVKGLAAAAGTKVIGVPTMDAIVMNAPENRGSVAPFLDAHKGKVYTCIYERSEGGLKRITDYTLAAVEEILNGLEEEVFFFGSGVIKYKDKLENCALAQYNKDVDWYPKAADIGRLGHKKSLEGADDPETIDPLYLHSKECNIIQ